MNTLWKERVLVQLRGNVVGPFPVSDLRRLSGFTPQTLISFPGSEKWAPAFRVLNQTFSFDTPLEVSLAGGSVSPQMDGFPGLDFISQVPKRGIIDFVAADPEPGIADRWFRRLVIFNVLLVLAFYAAWSYPPFQVPFKDNLQIAASQVQRLTPFIEHVKQRTALSSRIRAFKKALLDFGKVESDLLDALKIR